MRKHVLVPALAMLGVTIAAYPAHAINPNQLMGDWQVQNNTTCLTAPGGFNANLQPLNPSQSSMAQSTSNGIETFGPPTSIAANGDITGNVTRNFTVLGNGFTASAENTGFVPNASKTVYSNDVQTYHIHTGQNTISITVQDEFGSIVAGPRAGQTQVIDDFTVAGTVSADHKTIYWSTPDPVVENITYSNGQSYPRICHRATTLTKTH